MQVMKPRQPRGRRKEEGQDGKGLQLLLALAGTLQKMKVLQPAALERLLRPLPGSSDERETCNRLKGTAEP